MVSIGNGVYFFVFILNGIKQFFARFIGNYSIVGTMEDTNGAIYLLQKLI